VSGARNIATAAAVLAAAAVGGCGVGAGEADEGTASLTVTRDHGAELLVEASLEDPTATQSVVRFLDRETEIETSYGGNFVDSIDGIAGKVSGGRSEDWFFYVNGYWSPVGAGEARVRAGDRIWWDYRDWTDAYRVPAVVGSFPEPFRDGFGGRRFPTEVVCFDVESACAEVNERLTDAGAELLESGVEGAGERGEEVLRVLVGSWGQVREDASAAVLEDGPEASGVYGMPSRCAGAFAFEVLDERAVPRELLGEAAWVAAVRPDEDQPTWVVSATKPELVAAAAALLDEQALANRYAVVASGGRTRPLPASGAPPPEPEPEQACR
jgi:hypothetical protein